MGMAQVKLGLIALLVVVSIAGTVEASCFYVVDVASGGANPPNVPAIMTVANNDDFDIWTLNVRPGDFVSFNWTVSNTCQEKPCILKISLDNPGEDDFWNVGNVRVRGYEQELATPKIDTVFLGGGRASPTTSVRVDLNCFVPVN